MGIVKEQWLERENLLHTKHHTNKWLHEPWKTCPCEYCKARRKENK